MEDEIEAPLFYSAVVTQAMAVNAGATNIAANANASASSNNTIVGSTNNLMRLVQGTVNFFIFVSSPCTVLFFLTEC